METERLLPPEGETSAFAKETPPSPRREESMNQNEKSHPLVNLEGSDWVLTTLLLTLDAILLELYRDEKAHRATFVTWFYRYSGDSSWYTEMLDTLFVMLVAIVNVSLLIPTVNVNVRIPSKQSWRLSLFIAWCSLVLANVMTFWQLRDSIQMCLDEEEDDVKSWTAHFWLVSTAVVTAVCLDARFVSLYGFFTLFVRDGNKAIDKVEGLKQVRLRQERFREQIIRRERNLSERTTTRLNVIKPPQLHRFNTNRFLEHVSVGFTNLLTREQRLTRLRQMEITHRFIGSHTADPTSLSAFLTESWVQRAKGYIGQKFRQVCTEVAEIENVFEYSSWIKSAAAFSFLMLVYNCAKTTEIFFKLASSWESYHDLASTFQTDLDIVRDELDHLGKNITTAESEIGTASTATESISASLSGVTTTIDALQQTIGTFDNATGSAYDLAGMMLDVALLTTTRLVNVTDLKGNAVVSAFFYVDSIIPILKYTCLVGYPIGTLIGLHSLYQVLVQHKRMSIAFEQALTVRTASILGQGDVGEDDAKATLFGIDKKYQIGGAVYFFGILMSTAVVQQHLFGFFATLMLAVVVDLRKFDILLEIGGYLVFVYLTVMIINLLLTHVIGDRLLTREGFQIRHPMLFFFYLFAFSMVHAVLGLLYALWRAVLLLVTTFWVLNRLDVSLFLTGKQLDNGHYSFMSMLLLTRVIRLTNIAQGYVRSTNNPNETTDNSSTDVESIYRDPSSATVQTEFRSQELAIAENHEEGDEIRNPPVIPRRPTPFEIRPDVQETDGENT